MVAINKILLPECIGGGRGGETDICTDSRVHRRNPENRVSTTRSHRPTQPLAHNLYQGTAARAVRGMKINVASSRNRWLSNSSRLHRFKPGEFVLGPALQSPGGRPVSPILDDSERTIARPRLLHWRLRGRVTT